MIGQAYRFAEDLVEQDEVLTYLKESTEEIESLTGPTASFLCRALLHLMLRMLRDHLLEGKYSGMMPQDQPAMQSVIPHNKLPEFVFGQLDFLVRYRPNASALVNESFLMYSMNKTGEWLRMLGENEKEALLVSVRKEEQTYREKFKA